MARILHSTKPEIATLIYHGSVSKSASMPETAFGHLTFDLGELYDRFFTKNQNSKTDDSHDNSHLCDIASINRRRLGQGPGWPREI
jgi:hypothetical protein